MNGPLTRLWSVLRGLRGTHWKLAWGPNFQNEALLLALWLQTCSCVCVRVCIHTHICTLMHTQGTFTYVQRHTQDIHIYTYPHPEMHAYKYIHMHVTGNWATGRGAFDDGGAIFQTVCATRPEIVRTPRK